MVSPHDGDVAAGGPTQRRRLMDLLLAQMSPAYFDEARQVHLLEHIRGAQALVTVTTLTTLPALPGDRATFHVVDGWVEAPRAYST